MIRNLFKILFFIGIFVIFLHPIDSDGDFFQHVNIGRHVLEKQSLPYVDDLTFTAEGKSYLGYSWGSGIIFYLIYKYIGPIGVNLFVAGVATLTALILFRFLQAITKSDKTSLLTIALSFPVIATRFPSRPEIMTYLFVATLLLINELRQRYTRLNLLFPIIILLWASMYSVSLIVGLGLLFLFIINQWILDKRRFVRQQRRFYLALLICLPMAFLNGYGVSALFYILQVPKATEFHGDWASIGKILSTAPDQYLLVYQYTLLIFFLYLGLFILVAIVSYKNIRSHLFFLLLSLGLLVPFFAARQMPLAVLLSTPLLAVLLSPSLRWHKQLVSLSLFVAAVSILIFIKTHPPATGEDLESFPPSMISFIKNNQLEGRVFNTQRIGSFLSYHLYPKVKVFADTRDDLFIDTNILQEMGKIIHAKQNMSALLNNYQVDMIIADLTEGGSYQYLLGSWAPVYLDSLYLILVPPQVVYEKKLTVFDAINPYAESAVIPGRAEEAIKQYQQVLALFGPSFNNQLRLALALSAAGRRDQAIAALSNDWDKIGQASPFLEKERQMLLLKLNSLPK
ncbi:hypothetical protein HYS94_01230 [Candidatus Daviesbacteria bacterium]|nr:hypothetical protein [Candidatus Daviesbacteria bacterium]